MADAHASPTHAHTYARIHTRHERAFSGNLPSEVTRKKPSRHENRVERCEASKQASKLARGGERLFSCYREKGTMRNERADCAGWWPSCAMAPKVKSFNHSIIRSLEWRERGVWMLGANDEAAKCGGYGVLVEMLRMALGTMEMSCHGIEARSFCNEL